MSVEELQSAVSRLPAEELDRFSRWFEEFLAEPWDRRQVAPLASNRGHVATRGRGEALHNRSRPRRPG